MITSVGRGSLGKADRTTHDEEGCNYVPKQPLLQRIPRQVGQPQIGGRGAVRMAGALARLESPRSCRTESCVEMG
jgi:hypothetical protein